jgi:hypothetical protein
VGVHRTPHKAGHHRGSKSESAAKEPVKPQGPLIIAISIEQQSLKIYDANGFFAQTPISTGMRGHPTPMGVFSVIQKQKFHRSNIYSGAPMPFMQRITWSGVAMHAGVLPGYPASHGCIRMPMNFAVRMYGWTKMGARVVVTPGELMPSSFSHPLLAAQKSAAATVASAQKASPSATLSDKAAAADAYRASAASETAPPITRQQTQTADASGTLPQSVATTTMSDVSPSASGPASPALSHDASPAAAKSEAAPGIANSAEAAAANTTPVGAKPAETITPEAKAAADKSESRTIAAAPALPASAGDATKPATADASRVQALPSEAEKAAAKADPAPAPKRTGQIAVFVSRKDNKLYVRQNFAPVFEVPVTIATSDRPLGTHVFTARADKDDPKTFHWSVVSLPVARHAERRDDDEHVSRRRKTVGAIETKPAPSPDGPAEALDRITIPEDAMAKITDALSTGGSVIVSDQGISAGETGEGTDFIVSLH